ncbi:hypothetical protein BUALT_Bualt07G0112000 [Buddleja alternifolia]|uniref:Nucleolar protein 58/56 N-terminal domain-containing protein n=1 Tax=Buddleja alternifolia TaxID=168488 RepID=A0AAV6XKN5_9LAMI|nr:hypothetical protein BUALT_Bualt07G0112000 [Buddleja alternifolia]
MTNSIGGGEDKLVGNVVHGGAAAVGDVVHGGAAAVGDVVHGGAAAVGDVVHGGAATVGDVVHSGAAAVGDVVHGGAPCRRHPPRGFVADLQFECKSVPSPSLPLIFEPERMSTQIVARILIKVLIAMPAPDFSLCLFLIPKIVSSLIVRRNISKFVREARQARMLLLFETPEGFVVFKILDEGKLSKVEDLGKEFSTLDSPRQVVKLKAFSKFENTSEALSAAILLIESKPSKGNTSEHDELSMCTMLPITISFS